MGWKVMLPTKTLKINMIKPLNLRSGALPTDLFCKSKKKTKKTPKSDA